MPPHSGQSSFMQATPEYVLQTVMNICPLCKGTQEVPKTVHDDENCKTMDDRNKCLIPVCYKRILVDCPHCEQIRCIFAPVFKRAGDNCPDCNGTREVGAKGIYLDCVNEIHQFE